jgi:signal transduction histidine kinase
MPKGYSNFSKDVHPRGRPEPPAHWIQPSQKQTGSKKGYILETMAPHPSTSTVNTRQNGEAPRVLIGRLIKAQEEERCRLARELHDGLSQQLAMLTVELGMLVRQSSDKNPAICEQVKNLQGRVSEIAEDLRRMTHQLHPASLDHLGLVPAIRNHCKSFSQAEGIQVWFQNPTSLESVPPETSLCLFRIVQEALRNVTRHSRAREAWVEIELEEDQIHLRVTDKGAGFNEKDVATAQGLGLISMRERAQLLSGTLLIASAPGRGTSVDVRVPFRVRAQIKTSRRSYAKSQDFAG